MMTLTILTKPILARRINKRVRKASNRLKTSLNMTCKLKKSHCNSKSNQVSEMKAISHRERDHTEVLENK